MLLSIHGYVTVRACIPHDDVGTVHGCLQCRDMVEWGMKVSSEYLECLMSDKSYQIALSPGGGRIRRELSPVGNRLVKGVLDTTAACHQLAVPGLEFAGMYAIQNTRACTEEQGMHTDYEECLVAPMRGTPLFPRSALWAASAPFNIARRGGSPVAVSTGHVLFFVADRWPAGTAFLTGRPRFHAFQKPRSLCVPVRVYD